MTAGKMYVPTDVLAPILTSPATPRESSDTYFSKSLALFITSRANSRNRWPASVISNGRFDRSNSLTPSSFSRSAMWVLMAD